METGDRELNVNIEGIQVMKVKKKGLVIVEAYKVIGGDRKFMLLFGEADINLEVGDRGSLVCEEEKPIIGWLQSFIWKVGLVAFKYAEGIDTFVCVEGKPFTS